jgi:hypothetical protein
VVALAAWRCRVALAASRCRVALAASRCRVALAASRWRRPRNCSQIVNVPRFTISLQFRGDLAQQLTVTGVTGRAESVGADGFFSMILPTADQMLPTELNP